MIHPTALVSSHAQVDPSCEIGPYAIVDAHVILGANCRLGPHVHLTGHTTIGSGNIFHTGCVIGDSPQDMKYKGEPTRLSIGDHNIFREHVTIHCSNKMTEDTVVGSHNFLMAHSHVGHNSWHGDRIMVANGAQIAGHVTIGDSVFISGNCGIHQFVRIGRFALMQGGSVATQDLPPATMMRGVNELCGLNIIGLRRAGVTSVERLELKRLYHQLFRSGRNLSTAAQEAAALFTTPLALETLHFIATTQRGVCSGTSKSPEALDTEPETVD